MSDFEDTFVGGVIEHFIDEVILMGFLVSFDDGLEDAVERNGLVDVCQAGAHAGQLKDIDGSCEADLILIGRDGVGGIDGGCVEKDGVVVGQAFTRF